MRTFFKKKLILILSTFVLALCCIFGAAPITVKETASAETTSTLTIESNNLSYADSLHLLYAVSNEGFDRTQNEIKMLFWEEAQEDYAYGTQTSIATDSGFATVNEKDCLVFYSRGLAAKEMTLDIFARAYVEVDGVGFYSEVSKFSVFEYVYTMRDYHTIDSATDTLFT